MTRQPDKLLLDALAQCAARAWDDGCPVTHRHQEIAAVTLRRWRSFERRSKVKRPTFEHRVEDLARGLRDALDPEPALVGPLMIDYRHLAGVLAQVLARSPTAVPPHVDHLN